MGLRIIALISAPFLMAPVVLYIFGAFLILRPTGDDTFEQVAKIQYVATSLKMGEIALESLPQLVTQWCSVQIRTSRTLATLDNFSGLNFIQSVSIVTSTLTVARSLMEFFATHRSRNFVSPHYPTAASLLPLALFLLSGITVATTQFRYAFFDPFNSFGSAPSDLWHYYDWFLWGSNLLSFLVSLLILYIPLKPSLCWRVTRTLLHLSFACCPFIMVIMYVNKFSFTFLIDWLDGIQAANLFYFTILCWGLHLILGVLIFGFGEFVPCITAPLILLLVETVRRVAKSCCLQRFHLDIDEILDGVVEVDGVDHVRGGRDDELETDPDGQWSNHNGQARNVGEGEANTYGEGEDFDGELVAENEDIVDQIDGEDGKYGREDVEEYDEDFHGENEEFEGEDEDFGVGDNEDFDGKDENFEVDDENFEANDENFEGDDEESDGSDEAHDGDESDFDWKEGNHNADENE